MYNSILSEHINKLTGIDSSVARDCSYFYEAVSNSLDDLENKNKELNHFAYIVSHDLKAPLRGISSILTWLEEDLETCLKDETKETFEILKSRVKKMENLITGILQYSKASHPEIYEPVQTKILINEVLQTLPCPPHIHIELADNFPLVHAEKVKLGQVFSNLISNAIKYNDKEKGLVKIDCADHESSSRFIIEDNGPGIEKQYHDKIFMMFQTLQSEVSSENTGVGLAIVKKIIEKNGGEIWVESDLGKGSKFIFTVPKQQN